MAYDGGNTTGFPSPATIYLEDVIDLAAILDLRKPGPISRLRQGRCAALARVPNDRFDPKRTFGWLSPIGQLYQCTTLAIL